MEKSALHKGATAHRVKPVPKPARELGHFPPDEGFLPPHKGWDPLLSHHQSTAGADWRCGDADLGARGKRGCQIALSLASAQSGLYWASLWPRQCFGSKDASFILLAQQARQLGRLVELPMKISFGMRRNRHNQMVWLC